MRTVPSAAEVTTRESSGLKEAELGTVSCPRKHQSSAPISLEQMRTALSPHGQRIHRPFRLKTGVPAAPAVKRITRASLPVAVSQRLSLPRSADAVVSTRAPVGS